MEGGLSVFSFSSYSVLNQYVIKIVISNPLSSQGTFLTLKTSTTIEFLILYHF